MSKIKPNCAVFNAPAGREEHPAVLRARNGHEVALKGVKVRGRLQGVMAQVEVEQSYTNPQNTNIETIYTFPLAMGATLLGFEVEIDGKKLAGSVVEKKQAERRYEDAITDGDSAIMLEEAGPGLYTVNVGNLMAGESAVIRYRYALLLAWQGDQLRFMLPTTIAPRYGDPLADGLQPHQVPTASLLVDYPLDIAISVEGELAGANLSSPSHAVAFERSDTGTVVQLNRKAYLDRDFILILQSETAQSSCVLTADRDGYVALASLRIPQCKNAAQRPLALKVAIDCSGSMAGSSINQARKAALEILNLLRPQDYFNITLFGDKPSHLFPALVLASAQNITAASARLALLDADMGGTEMENALKAVFSMSAAKEDAAVLLITDGEIYEYEKLVQRAGESGHCVFTVGVGNAVNDVFLHALASATGGACELVSPQEGMAERVVMQFHRMRQPRLGALRLEWPGKPEWQTPLPQAVFAGDTVQVFAGFLQPVDGDVSLVIEGSNGVPCQIVSIHDAELPRMAAAQRMSLAGDTAVLQLALDYQLMSKWTNYLVIAERADKADDLPELHHVPQMLAAGWGGVGDGSIISYARSSVQYCELDAPIVMRSARRAAVDAMGKSGVDTYDIPSFLRKQEDGTGSANSAMATIKSNFTKSTQSGPAKFMSNFANRYSSLFGWTKLPDSVAELREIEIDDEIACALLEIVDLGHDEAEVIAAFIYALSESAIGVKFSRLFKRTILKRWKMVVKNHEIDSEMKESLAMVTLEAWNWQFQAAENCI